MISDLLEKAEEIGREIFVNLDNAAVLELAGGYGRDLAKLYDDTVKTAYSILSRENIAPIQSASFGYLDKFTTQIDEYLKADDISYFIATLFPDFIFDWHILEWGQFVKDYRQLVVVAARGRGKSFFFGEIYPIWRAYSYSLKGKFPKAYLGKEGAIISSTETQAKKRLENIRNLISENPYLSDKLKPETKEGWGAQKLRFKNGAQVYALGFTGQIRGFHPTFLVNDDILSENQLTSKKARQDASKKFFGSMRKLMIDGQHVVVGTPFHRNDLYAELRLKKGWRVFTYPGIFPDGKILGERRFNFQYIKEEREDLGAIFFSREILCLPVSEESSIFPYEIVRKAFIGMDDKCLVSNRMATKGRFVRIVLGCDFAISSTVGADYSVFITIGVDDEENYHVLNIFRDNGISYSAQKNKIKELHANFQYDVIYCESNQMQSIFPQELEKEGLPVFAHHTGANKINLKTGLPNLSVLFEKKKIKFPRGDEESINKTDVIVSELGGMAFTDSGIQGVGEHDDTVMALWIATLAARHGTFHFEFIEQ